jgi:hypothetical protein
MRSAIAVGGQVLTVEILQTEEGYAASCSDLFRGETRAYAATGDSYDAALQALRTEILAGRT